jgi:hypothetical protein
MPNNQEVSELNSDDMISVTQRLTQILKEEISLIKEMNLLELHKFNEEKRKLSSLMDQYKTILKNNPMIVKSMDKATFGQMRKALDEFETMLEEDGKQLIKVQKVHSIIMNAIKKAVEEQNRETALYNKFGEVDLDKKKILFIAPMSISKSF